MMGGMTGGTVNVSFIADAVLLLRFFEAGGRIRKAISVVKNRAGPHEDAIRELRVDAHGLRVGEPLTQLRGVLSGIPTYVGDREPLMEPRTRDGL
jgi:circadian clock protein KaiC